jgi:hypothetical protein
MARLAAFVIVKDSRGMMKTCFYDQQMQKCLLKAVVASEFPKSQPQPPSLSLVYLSSCNKITF